VGAGEGQDRERAARALSECLHVSPGRNHSHERRALEDRAVPGVLFRVSAPPSAIAPRVASRNDDDRDRRARIHPCCRPRIWQTRPRDGGHQRLGKWRLTPASRSRDGPDEGQMTGSGRTPNAGSSSHTFSDSADLVKWPDERQQTGTRTSADNSANEGESSRKRSYSRDHSGPRAHREAVLLRNPDGLAFAPVDATSHSIDPFSDGIQRHRGHELGAVYKHGSSGRPFAWRR